MLVGSLGLAHPRDEPPPILGRNAESSERVGARDDVRVVRDLVFRHELFADPQHVVGKHALEQVVRLPRLPAVDLVGHDEPLVRGPRVERALGHLSLAGKARVVPPDERRQDALAQGAFTDALRLADQQDAVAD